MNNQKDTQKTDINSYGHNTSPRDLTLSFNAKYDFFNKKTEKLITALYMVTDYMETGDAIKMKVRNLGVELLSDIHSLSLISPVEKHIIVSSILVRINEVLSLVEIANMVGSISEMNACIIKKEFGILIREIQSFQSENQTSFFGKTIFENNKVSGLNLTEKMFEVEEGFKQINQSNIIKDTSLGQISQKTNYNMSVKNNRPYAPAFSTPKLFHQKISTGDNKKERTNKILSLIKDKRDLPAGEAGVSIKDISVAFSDCSEKTIQRELNSLVSKGQIKKIGAKRWSRYQSI